MKPAPFAYHSPATVADVVGLLAEYGDSARPLAGGQSLLPLLASRTVRPRHLIDLNRATGLAFVRRGESGLRVGALTRLRHIENDPVVRTASPLLSTAAALAGPVQVRNRATVGGALAQADPAAEFPAVAVALDARIELRGERVRQIVAADFFLAPHRTAGGATELVTAVEFPPWPESVAFAVQRTGRRSTGVAGAVVLIGLETIRIVLFGVARTPVRSGEAETALAAGATAHEVADVAVAGLIPGETGALARGAVARAVTMARNKVRHG